MAQRTRTVLLLCFLVCTAQAVRSWSAAKQAFSAELATLNADDLRSQNTMLRTENARLRVLVEATTESCDKLRRGVREVQNNRVQWAYKAGQEKSIAATKEA